MQEQVRTISLQASEISWDDVDLKARNTGFKDRSRYIQYLVEKDIFKSKHDFTHIFTIVILLILAMLTLAVLLKV